MFSIELGKASLGFCAAHFLVAHDKCSRMHGHNYRVRVGVTGEMGASGMVVDFGYLRERALEVCRELDGRVLLAGESPDVKCKVTGGEVEVGLPDLRGPVACVAQGAHAGRRVRRQTPAVGPLSVVVTVEA